MGATGSEKPKVTVRISDRVTQARESATRAAEKAVATAEKGGERFAPVRAALGLVESDRRTGGSLLAGGLAYRIFLFSLPLGLFLGSLLRIVSDVTEEPAGGLASKVGIGATLARAIGKASEASGRGAPLLLVMGAFLLLWTSRSMWKALCITSEIAWGIRDDRRKTPVNIVLLTLFFLGITLLPAALSFLYKGNFTVDVVATLITTIAFAMAAALGFSKLPRIEGVPWTSLLPGALIMAIGIELLHVVTAIYLASRGERTIDLYGAIGVGAVLMGYLYLMGRIVVGALFANAQWWRTRHPEPGN